MTTPPSGYLLYVLFTSIICSVLSLAMLLQVVWQGYRERENQLMAIFLLSISLGSTAVILRQIANFILGDLPILIGAMLLSSFMIGMPSLLGFIESFAQKSNANRFIINWSWASIAIGLSAPFLLIPNGLLISNIVLVDFNHIAFEGEPVLLSLIALNILMQLAYLQILTYRYRKQLPKSVFFGVFTFVIVYIAALLIQSFVESNLSTLFALVYAYLFSRAIFVRHHLSPLVKLNELLQESETRYRGIVDTVFDFDFVIEHQKEDEFTFHWTKSSDYFPSEMFPTQVNNGLQQFTKYMTPDSKLAFKYLEKQVLQGKAGDLELQLRVKENQDIWIHCYIYPVWSNIENRVLRAYGVARDITAQKLAERALIESESRFRAIFAQTLQMIILFDANGKLVQMNETAVLFTGPLASQLIGKDIRVLARLFIDKSMHHKLKSHIQGALKGMSSRDEWLINDAKGNQRILDVFVKTIRDLEGNAVFIIWEAHDITAQKKTATAMIQTQKIESLGVLAGGVAHDFNNLLTGILAQSSLAKMKLGEDHKAVKNIDKAIFAAEQAAALTRQMLAYAGKSDVILEPISLNQIIADNRELFKATTGNNVTLNLSLDEALPLINGDRGQIQQIVMNLMINAAEAIGNNAGQIDIQTSTVALNTRQLEAYLSKKPLETAQYLELKVQDNGCGLSPEVKDRIFDPFFTTKKEGRGLGLAALLGAVHAHLGGIYVESKVGVGTTFNIIFPTIQDQAGVQGLQQISDLPKIELDKPLTVLLADDEQTVRHAVEDALEYAGWHIISAANGREAVDLYQEYQQEIDVILLDVQMPIMNGIAAYHQIVELNPKAKIILSSGYESDESAGSLAVQNKIPFIKKPYQISLLLHEIAEIYRSGK